MRRRGNMVVIMAFALIVVTGIGAFAIDLGAARVSRTELRFAADAAALAAAASLDGTAGGLETARSMAAAISERNDIAGSPFALATGGDGELELGRWESDAFVADTSDPTLVTAARVRARRTDLRLWMAPVPFGERSVAVSAAAVALAGGPRAADCPAPIAIPSCSLPSGDGICNYDLTLGPDGGDNGAWALVGTTHPSASSVRAAIESCANVSTTADVVSLNNGQITSAARTLADAISASSTGWDAEEWGAMPAQNPRSGVSPYGHVYETSIIVFEDPSDCSDTKFNGSGLKIEGYASAVIYDAVTTGRASERAVSMRLVCETVQEPGGGKFFGTDVPPALVE